MRLGRTAAVKLLAPAVGEADFRERFLRESRLAASLDHPSIVPVFDAGEEDGLLYIAMARVEGSDLRTLLRQEGRLPVRRALRIVAQIASALDAAHARGLVHRDVKPANVLVGSDDRAYLSDFGVVKELATLGTTRTGTFVGTIAYCAPEQIEGRGDLDARADQYALACVLYECLVGTSPFHRSSEVAMLNAHLHTPPPKLTKTAPDLPAALEPVLAKALSKSPLDRYGSCGEFVAAARAAVSEKRVDRRRLAISLVALAVAAGLGAATALGVASLVRTSSKLQATTVVRTLPPPPPAALDKLALESVNGPTLNDAAYFLIQAREYARAIPFARKALRHTSAGSATRGYATFNLGFALLEVGRCAEALPLLEQALAIEAPDAASQIRPRIRQAQACLQGGASAPAPSRSSGAPANPSQAL